MTNTLQKTVFLKADQDTVWAYLTDPAKLEKWFHRPKTPLTDAASYAMYGRDSGDKLMWGDVIKADPHEYLEYTFTITPMGDAVSTVKWTLTSVPGGTKLSLIHEGLPDSEAAFGLTLALDKGWDGHFAELRADLEK